MKIRKKKDKRVLKSRYNKPPSRSKLKIRRNRNRNVNRNRNRGMPRGNPPYQPKKKQASRTTLLIIVIALVAFVIGAGIGVSMALSNPDDGPHFQNVTKEMTSNLNQTDPAYLYDDVEDSVDYNSREDMAKLNISKNNVSY